MRRSCIFRRLKRIRAEACSAEDGRRIAESIGEVTLHPDESLAADEIFVMHEGQWIRDMQVLLYRNPVNAPHPVWDATV